MNDYVILFDENGQPYVAHSQIITNLRSGAKSVAKLVDGVKTRYFKTQKELQAYYNQAMSSAANKAKAVATTARQKASDALGITAKNAAQTAERNYINAKNNRQNANIKKINADVKSMDASLDAEIAGAHDRGLAAEFLRGFGKTREKQYALLKNEERAKHEYENASRSLGRAQELEAKAKKEYEDAYAAYASSPIGRFDDALHTVSIYARNTLNDVSDALDIAKDKASDTYDKAKKRVSDALDIAKDKASDTYDKAKKRVSDTVDSAKDRLSDTVDAAKEGATRLKKGVADMYENYTGVGAKKALDKSKAKLDRSNRDLERAELQAEKVYGRAEIDSNGNAWSKTPGEAHILGQRLSGRDGKEGDIANAQRSVDFWQNMYANTPLGKIDAAMTALRNHGTETLESISNGLSNARTSATNAINSAKEAASNAFTSARNSVAKVISKAEYNRLISKDASDLSRDDWSKIMTYIMNNAK